MGQPNWEGTKESNLTPKTNLRTVQIYTEKL